MRRGLLAGSELAAFLCFQLFLTRLEACLHAGWLFPPNLVKSQVWQFTMIFLFTHPDFKKTTTHQSNLKNYLFYCDLSFQRKKIHYFLKFMGANVLLLKFVLIVDKKKSQLHSQLLAVKTLKKNRSMRILCVKYKRFLLEGEHGHSFNCSCEQNQEVLTTFISWETNRWSGRMPAAPLLLWQMSGVFD